MKYKIEVKWAIIFALLTLTWILLEKISGLHSTHIDKHAIYTNFFAIPAIAVYIFALLEKRKNYYHGNMNYLQGFVTGLIVTLVVVILSPLTQSISSTVITPEYFPNIIQHSVSTGKMEQEAAGKYFSLGNYVVQGLIGASVMGIITSAVVAIFTRRKKN